MTDRERSAGSPRPDQPADQDRCDLCGPELELDDSHRLRLRHLVGRDEDGLRRLYSRLSTSDLHWRFFTGALPPPSFFERWASIGETGGFGLAAEVDGPEGLDIVGEAGYAPLDDGDGELGITVDREHRGWLGPWLLDSLLAHARARGVLNLQALILADNNGMMALARKRGFAVLGHPDWSTVRLTMSTDGHTPSWPQAHDRPRLLIESQRTRWGAEDDMRAAGFDVAICSGPCRSQLRCPVLSGEPCPLIEGAEAVVVDLMPDDPETIELLKAERVIHPAVRLISGFTTGPDGRQRRRTSSDLLAELDDLTAEPAPGGDDDEPDEAR